MNAKKKKFIHRLKHKYRLIIYNDNTFEEVWFVRLSPLNVLAMTGLVILLLFSLNYLLVAFTPLREMIPGYPDPTIQRKVLESSERLDSLEKSLVVRDRYLENIKSIIGGNPPVDYDTITPSEKLPENITFSRSIEDSLLRKRIEEEEQYNLLVVASQGNLAPGPMPSMHFFPPLKGIITNSFDPAKDHFGTDIVTSPNEIVKATLDGTVVMAAWTLETGYVIQIQHENNLVSLYKHNAEILKKSGERVNAGDAIAIVGNSGELTTGPHLHFELWYNGSPVDPESYIIF